MQPIARPDSDNIMRHNNPNDINCLQESLHNIPYQTHNYVVFCLFSGMVLATRSPKREPGLTAPIPANRRRGGYMGHLKAGQ